MVAAKASPARRCFRVRPREHLTGLTPSLIVALVARLVAGAFSGLLGGMLAGCARRIVPVKQSGKVLAMAMTGTPQALLRAAEERDLVEHVRLNTDFHLQFLALHGNATLVDQVA